MSTTSDEGGSSLEGDAAKIAAARAAARARFAHHADGDAVGSGDVAYPDPDNPPMTDAQFESLRPAAEVVPGLVAARLHRGNGQPTSEESEVAVSIRLDAEVVAALRSSGEGWQRRVNDLLRSALAIGPASSPPARR